MAGQRSFGRQFLSDWYEETQAAIDEHGRDTAFMAMLRTKAAALKARLAEAS
jgi:hypothetical protein